MVYGQCNDTVVVCTLRQTNKKIWHGFPKYYFPNTRNTMNTTLGSGQALKPYVAQVSKLSSDSAVANLIPTILSDTNVYVFGELLQVESIQALTKGDYKKWHDLLSIFAYGRYSDYVKDAENLPKISPKQMAKLRQLTVVSLAAENRVIPYSTFHPV